jgi:hypothetical protein
MTAKLKGWRRSCPGLIQGHSLNRRRKITKIVGQNHSWPLTAIETACISGLGFASLFPFLIPICSPMLLNPELYRLCTLCVTSRMSSLWDLRLGAVKFSLIMKFKTESECFPNMSVMISGCKFCSGGGNYKNGQSFPRVMFPDFRTKIGLTPAVL